MWERGWSCWIGVEFGLSVAKMYLEQYNMWYLLWLKSSKSQNKATQDGDKSIKEIPVATDTNEHRLNEDKGVNLVNKNQVSIEILHFLKVSKRIPKQHKSLNEHCVHQDNGPNLTKNRKQWLITKSLIINKNKINVILKVSSFNEEIIGWCSDWCWELR